ncbi:MAG: hypothetical protein WCV50_02185 [Patescibacteria group bacterium]|jgi:hypothetical protein
MAVQEKNNEARPAEPVKQVRIHTMPSKFYLDENKSGSGKNIFLVVFLIILAVLVLGGGGYFAYTSFYQNKNQNSNANSLANENEEGDLNDTNSSANANGNKNANTNGSNTNNANRTNVNAVDINSLNIFNNLNQNTNTGNFNINTVVSSADADLDGLSDVEEPIYSTKISSADSDGDGFSDGQEVINGYNPNGTGKLELNAGVLRYTDTDEKYSLLYPKTWVVSDDNQTSSGKIFSANGQFVTISVELNAAKLSARDWYLTKSPGIDSSRIQSVTNWDATLAGVKSIDGLTVYYTKNDQTFIISYNINILTQADYLTTFAMMYKSFTLVTANFVNSNANSNSNTSTNFNFNTNINTNTNRNTNSNLNSNANTNRNTNSNSNSTNHL